MIYNIFRCFYIFVTNSIQLFQTEIKPDFSLCVVRSDLHWEFGLVRFSLVWPLVGQLLWLGIQLNFVKLHECITILIFFSAAARNRRGSGLGPARPAAPSPRRMGWDGMGWDLAALVVDAFWMMTLQITFRNGSGSCSDHQDAGPPIVPPGGIPIMTMMMGKCQQRRLPGKWAFRRCCHRASSILLYIHSSAGGFP